MAHATLTVTFRYSFVVVHTTGIHVFAFLFIRCFLKIREIKHQVMFIMPIDFVNTLQFPDTCVQFLYVR